jgi:iron complex outermembrane recepter protein
MRLSPSAVLSLVVWACFACQSMAQSQDTTATPQSLPTVSVSATRLATPLQRLPFAADALDSLWVQRGLAQRSLGEALAAVPGVVAWNTDNYAQDLRISIRGFGARSAFGVRGIRVFTDGVPDTAPDGQTDLDNLDMGAVARLEALRGPAAALYGNAAGGVLLATTDAPTGRYAEVRTTAGSFGMRRAQAKLSWQKAGTGIIANASHLVWDGYRDHSGTRQTIVNLKWEQRFSQKTTSTLLLNHGQSPYAYDAGGLTEVQRDSAPQQPRAASLQFQAGEQVLQQRVGYVLRYQPAERHQLTGMGFFTRRDFDSRLPFKGGGWVDLRRNYGGGNLQYAYTATRFRTQLGLDVGRQRDHRQRFDNQEGTRGSQTFDQDENFDGWGAFGQIEAFLTKKINATAALRTDRVRLAATDHFLTDGDQSGSERFDRPSLSMGISWAPRAAFSLYANAGSHFETPTLNELSANPDQTGGFNVALKPQESQQFELGAKLLSARGIRLDVALFHIALRNEMVPYQLQTVPGRTFFRNAGASARTGTEIALQWRLLPGLALRTHYQYSNFRYKDYEANNIRYDGRQLPALAPRRIFAALDWQHPQGRWFATAQVLAQGRAYSDDANTVRDRGYALLSLRGGGQFGIGKVTVSPFVGANNLLGAAYSNNILVNAVGGRYFEPGPGVANFYGGVVVKI